ncbi:hypothetical protein [Mycobacterium paragordonae]|uniref:hypothetical protein n=1 Tax=Mycobacterium paragordonae TaxID=1389713 RepID=UPI0013C40D98|nr:hypothetical protein [Mycobacterium paragordonae]
MPSSRVAMPEPLGDYCQGHARTAAIIGGMFVLMGIINDIEDDPPSLDEISQP